MRAKASITFMAVICLLLCACKKGGTDAGPIPTAKLKYLTKLVAVNTGPGPNSTTITTTTTTNYTYDEQKRLKTLKSGNNVITYSYNGNNLFSIESVTGQIRNIYEISYEAGKVKRINRRDFNNITLTDEINYDYVYNGDKVSEIHFQVYYVLYTYDSKGNITKIFNHGSPDFEVSYTYDDKKSRWINAALRFPMVSEPAGDRLSPNNVISLTNSLAPPNSTSFTTYVYDDEGYPVSSASGTDINGVKRTYTYTTLD
jgi:uncharacterized protein YxjI